MDDVHLPGWDICSLLPDGAGAGGGDEQRLGELGQDRRGLSFMSSMSPS